MPTNNCALQHYCQVSASRKFSTKVFCGLLLWPLLFFAAPCFADYSITKVVSSLTDDLILTQGFAINDNGAVAYVRRTGASNATAIFVTDSGGTKRIAETADEFRDLEVTGLNNNGVVVFDCRFRTGENGVCTGSGAAITVISRSANPLGGRASINDGGVVAYVDENGRVMSWTNGATRVLFVGSLLDRLGHMNAIGTVSFAERESTRVIRFSAQGEITTIATGRELFGATPNSSINDAGVVAFDGFESGSRNFLIYKGSGGMTTVVRVPAGLSIFGGGLYGVSINNGGTVVCTAGNSSGLVMGVYAGTGAVLDKVVARGDTLFGGSIVPLVSTRHSARTLNNRGQIAFLYRLGSGPETGIALATPNDATGGGGDSGGSLLVANAASFSTVAPIAQNSIATIRGERLSTNTASASGDPASSLAGTSVIITDSNGTARTAPLFFVSPNQINLLVPPSVSAGAATIQVRTPEGRTVPGNFSVSAVSPGLFVLNAGALAAANALRLRNGVQTYEPVFSVFNGEILPTAIDLGPAGDQVYLIFYGTGFRQGRSCSLTIGTRSIPMLFAGASQEYPGLDQANVGPLPRDLAGTRSQSIRLTCDGAQANATTLVF